MHAETHMCVHPHTFLAHSFIIRAGILPILPAVLDDTCTSSFAVSLILPAHGVSAALDASLIPVTCQHNSLFAAQEVAAPCLHGTVVSCHCILLLHLGPGFPVQLLDTSLKLIWFFRCCTNCSPCNSIAVTAPVMGTFLWIMHVHVYVVWS